MKTHLLKAAGEVIPDQGILVNVVSRRVRQLTNGHRPLVQVPPGTMSADIALTEIIQGKLTFECTPGLNAKPEPVKVMAFPRAPRDDARQVA